ncbi:MULTISPECIES: hypothetical protein [unclassified Halorubrum]|jgi:photosystem II stability/assembly factor-like uncharacterized protein|uniref:WD40/YVTN/BNR-like repeat-containing protein n=1 Tax=unclassified Halorubrum TaxID=2642239 RepID=UPI0010F82BAA|nr:MULTISPECIES: hypothetical protein [unclassified Halorubrum]TKX41010.1 hypothetical protein EXE50_16435 [Halorubrum sp. ARQ200]TKX48633.1 hypothetical protein EXE49_15770 [Halorubrum sp. ASP121]TKX63429.1 hypothetical protein EXE48_00115 [Halorubrum sp. ASP1]
MRIYAAYDDGLRIVDPATGAVETRLSGQRVECLSVARREAGADDPGRPRVLAGTFDAGLFRSVDGGERFARAAEATLGPEGSGPDAVTAVATSPHDPAVVWIGTEPSRTYRSADGGETADPVGGLTDLPSASEWSFPPRPDTHHVRWIEPCPADPERWLVGIEAGALAVTADGGATWTDRPAGARRDTHAMATHPDAPARVYAAAGDGFAESDDRGDSWRVPEAGLDHGYAWGLAVDPDDPDTALVSAAAGATAAHRRGESYLYRYRRGEEGGAAGSERGPGAFERLDDRGFPTGAGTYRAVLAAGRAAGEIWALSNRGLFVTRDAGDSFEQVPVDLPDRAARALAVG